MADTSSTNQPQSDYFKWLCQMLAATNWKEPTTKDLPTYLAAYKARGRNAAAPYFEDSHYCWRNFKPSEIN